MVKFPVLETGHHAGSTPAFLTGERMITKADKDRARELAQKRLDVCIRAMVEGYLADALKDKRLVGADKEVSYVLEKVLADYDK